MRVKITNRHRKLKNAETLLQMWVFNSKNVILVKRKIPTINIHVAVFMRKNLSCLTITRIVIQIVGGVNMI